MVAVPLSRLQPSGNGAIEDWPWLDQDVLRSSRSRQVWMTCHLFRHHPSPDALQQQQAAAALTPGGLDQ